MINTFMMKTYTAIVEKCATTGLYIGSVPGMPGVHSQGESLDELHVNLQEVLALVLEDKHCHVEGEFVGTQTLAVA